MKRLIIIATVVSLGGCAQIQSATDYLASPSASQAANNAAKFALAVDCGVVVPLAALGQQIASIVQAGDATVTTTGKVYAISQAVCQTITGIVAAQAAAK